MRFASTGDDNVENATGKWFFGDLVGYDTGFPTTQLRDKLMAYNFGSASLAIKDSAFGNQLNGARGNLAPAFDPFHDGPAVPGA